MNSRKAVVAGHICLDITPVFSKRNTGSPEKLFLPGKLISMEKADVHTGGAVANTGLAMSLFGLDVTLVGRLGADAFGRLVEDSLRAYEVRNRLIVSEDASTSYSIVIAPPGVDRIFLHNYGANDAFTSSDVMEEDMEEAVLFHFGYPPLMKSMYKNDGEELIRLFKKVNASGTATSLDLAAVDAETEGAEADWYKILSGVLPFVDFFVPSVEELCYMLDRPRFEEWTKRGKGKDITQVLDVERDILPLVRQCAGLGAKTVLLKCGAPGMYYWTCGEERLRKTGAKLELDYRDWAGRSGFEKSYRPSRVLSGTGAGDTSIAAFLSAVLLGYSFEECIHLSSAAGASCVEEYDALSGLKPLEELGRKIDEGWEKC